MCCGEEVEPGPLCHARARRTRGSTAATSRCRCGRRSAPSPALDAVERLRVADAARASSAARRASEQIADRRASRGAGTPRSRATPGVTSADVELVADVDVRAVTLACSEGDRLARELERDRHVPQPACRRRPRRPRPGNRSPARRAAPARARAAPTAPSGPVTTITCSPASRARRSAAIVRGRRIPSSQTSVRSKSVATTRDVARERCREVQTQPFGLPPVALTT